MDKYLQAINITNKKKGFELKDVSLTLKEGEITLIGGKNGSGKTTLLETLCLVQEPTEGRIECLGKRVYDGTINRKILKNIQPDLGAQFQNVQLFKNLTVKETLNLYSIHQTSSKLAELISECEPIQNYLDKRIGQLSSGKKQLTKFLLSIINEPKIVFLDEPGSNLDDITKRWIYNKIKKMKKQKVSFIITLNEEWPIIDISDKLIILNDGDIKKEIKNFNLIGNGTVIIINSEELTSELKEKSWIHRIEKVEEGLKIFTNLKKKSVLKKINSLESIEELRRIKLNDFY